MHDPATIHGLVEAQARRTPDAPALVSDRESLTYAELERRAVRLALRLRALGVGPEVPVGVLVDRSPRLVEALLGVLKAGGFYVPVDPHWPADRLAFLAEDSRAPIWISETALAGRLPVPAERVVFLDEPVRDADGSLPSVLPENLAYAIYTSGSTGRPKGVQIPHRAVVNFLESMRRRPGLDASDVLLAVTTVSFDIAVLELFLPLTAGARVVIAPRAATADAGALTELIERHGVTVLQATPATWRLLLASGWQGRPGLRILCGGEALPRDLADSLLERGAELWNLYGPTETTVWSAVQRVGSGPVTLGEPIDRTDLRLLGDTGELGIGGAGLSRGYLRRPDLTAERFMPHPDSPEPGARLYRTGDLVRSTPAGLEFLGRIDHQVKIRGFRIELGEIEAAMRSHPGVADAVAVTREAAPGDLRLVGYVTPSAGFTESGQDGWQAERIDQWRSVYDQASDLAAIWKSSYTGEPFPEDELRVYHGSTVERLLSLEPQRVLEIGCGTGPILLPLLPHVAHYCGTDFSDAALGVLRERLAETGEPLASRVRLLHRPADDFSDLEPGSFDLVILNSVAQYFPSPGYLLDVVEGALRLLRPGGFLFLGDLRSLPLLETLAASVRVFQAPFSLPAAQLRLQVKRQVEREPELLVDPAAVDALCRRFPGIRRAWTWVRRGRRDNELTRFRYDAVLEVGEQEEDSAPPVEMVWGREVASLEELRGLSTTFEALAVRRIPNARLTRELLALRLLESQDVSAGALRDALHEIPGREADAGVHPEDLWDLEKTLPYTVHVGWSSQPGEIDALLVRHGGAVPAFVRPEAPERPWSELVSDPLQGKVAAALVPALRGHLRDRLPEYMVPAALVVLRALPLTPNRKVDRNALPAPDLTRQESDEGFLAPRNAVEREVARVFAEVLGVERVGVRDDFFEMGGHSLLGTQLTYRLRDGFGVELPLNVLFEAPTVEALAARIGGLPRAVTSAVPEILEPDPGARHEPFPLNDIQQAYWIGRSPGLELGGVACRFYQQFEGRGIDLDRLELAWNRLVERHGMLRAVVAADGTQRILDSVPAYRIRVQDETIEATRHRMLHELRPPDEWPLFGVEAHCLPDGSLRIHVLLELLVVDGLSILILFEEWGRLYADPDLDLPPLHLSFRDYVLAEAAMERTERFTRARGYWMERLPALPPPPALPLARNPATLGRPEFVRHGTHLPADLWRRLKERAQRSGLWPSALLCAAYAEVLRVWSREPRFTLNLTLFNRLAVHPEVNRILGDFTTLDLLEVDGRSGASFVERARSLQARLFSDLENRAFSGVKVLRELARERPGSTARMPVVFTSFLEDFSRTDWLGPVVDRLGQTPQVWLDHVILERAGVLELDWYAVEELFPPGLLTAMFEAYTGLLHRLATEETAWDEARPVGLPAGQLAERALANATAAPVPAGLLHEPFLAQVPLRPDQPAVISPTRTLSYAELRRRSGRLARSLREAGARPNELVAVVMRKGWEQVVAVLAVLEAGAAYLPLDADLPPARLDSLIERGEARIVVTQADVAEATDEIDEPGIPSLAPVQKPDDLAYVLFTSGSTGVPKGVMIDHRGALNTVIDVNARFGVGPADRVLGLSALGFDLSVYDVFGVLGAGGTLVLPAAEERNEPARWAEWIERERITVWNSVPALLDLVMDEADRRLDSLRLVLLSGDWIPLSLPDRVRRRAPDARVVSLGGATEASIWSILHPVGEVAPSWRSIPYGRPMVNQTFHVLDEDLEPCPVWVPGHLHIGGIGLAKGYWRDEERTRESFLVHPRTGERLYRTGDLGRYLPGGDIEFLGREDGQVKIQGNRVELGEVESALALHPRVHAAAAAVRGPRDGARRLLAWYVPADPAPDPAELRAFLAGRLPAYMVPSQLVPLPALPLSANGKVDRAAPPEPEKDAGAGGGRLAPRDPVERVLAGLATALLDGERPGVEDNFFSVGGNSLTAIRLIARLRDRFHVEMPVVRFFDAPTVAGLAGSLLDCQVEHHGEAAVEPLLREVEAVPEALLEEALARELGLLGWEDA